MNPKAAAALIQSINDAVPFASHCNVQVEEISAEQGIAAMASRDSQLNHIGTVHAGALFTLGEAASGAAMIGIVGDALSSSRPVAASASIEYKRPAKGDLRAVAQAREPAASIHERLRTSGSAQFDLDIEITDTDSKVVAHQQVRWHVSRKIKRKSKSKSNRT